MSIDWEPIMFKLKWKQIATSLASLPCILLNEYELLVKPIVDTATKVNLQTRWD